MEPRTETAFHGGSVIGDSPHKYALCGISPFPYPRLLPMSRTGLAPVRNIEGGGDSAFFGRMRFQMPSVVRFRMTDAR